MSATRKNLISAAIVCATVGGLFAGCGLSDYIALSGFPHKKYLVEMAHDGSAKAVYTCQRLSNAYGPELSLFNEEKGIQDKCILEVTGDLLDDGSMLWYPGRLTWYGRLVQNFSAVHIPQTRIVKVTRSPY